MAGENETLGDRLRGLRLAVPMTQRGLAAKAGVSPGYIARLELGERKGNTATLGTIAQALGVSEHFLRTGDDTAAWIYVLRKELAIGRAKHGCQTCAQLLAEYWPSK